MKDIKRVIHTKGSDRKPMANDDNREPKVKDEIYKPFYNHSFYDNHTFIGTQGGSNVLAERDDCAAKAWCYDAE